jgi:uncharacterized membrane protein
MTTADDDCARAIKLLVGLRDELEMLSRSPGELVGMTRQAIDAALNDLGIVARLIRELAERLSRE